MSTPTLGPVAAAARLAHDPLTGALGEALARPGVDGELAAFYAAPGSGALWIQHGRVRPEARKLVELLSDAAADNLDPADYRLDDLRAALRAAAGARPADLARAELALSRAAADYGADLRRPKAGAGLLYSDPAFPSPIVGRRDVLDRLAAAPSLADGLAAMRRMSPIYERIRAALSAEQARGGPKAELLRLNLERARSLPSQFGSRYVLVDITAQKLVAIENGREVASMKVVVGKASQPTPAMAALIRYAVFRPYWNIPPDLVASSIAPRVLSQGLDYFRAEHLEALSDWSDQATPVDPEKIDWRAVADGRQELRVRQLPGRHNMMGRVKFVFPNELGVYLHDSPIRGLFGELERLGSSGCVRLEDAPRLARWLMGDAVVANGQAQGPPETRVDLPQPIPVYLVYFTAMPSRGGVAVRRDIYERDPPLIAALGRKVRQTAIVTSR
jgi:murein L,D-transpeptidase YcbB/YkuD